MHFTLRYGGSEQINVVASAAHNPGELVVYSGFVGVFNGSAPCKSGDTITITLNAVGDAVTATGVTFAVGALVYWDTVNKTCVASSGTNIIKLGSAVQAKVSGQLVTRVLMNRVPLT